VTTPVPWWLQEGSVLCEACETYHHAEGLIVCVWCDGPVCLVCVVDVVLSGPLVLCPSCARTAREEG
jgi:hypothetical protein